MLFSNLTETGNFIVYYQPATGSSGVYFQTQTAGRCILLISQRNTRTFSVWRRWISVRSNMTGFLFVSSKMGCQLKICAHELKSCAAELKICDSNSIREKVSLSGSRSTFTCMLERCSFSQIPLESLTLARDTV